jgi:hypothetical protein
MLLATHDIRDPVEADKDFALREAQKLTNPEDFIILTTDSYELRAAGPVKGEFLVQFEIRDKKISRERSDVLPEELESFIRGYFEGDTSWAEDFVKNSQPIPRWILVAAILFILVVVYATVT